MSQDSQPCEAVVRLFLNGRSQALRIPKALRLDADEVVICREGDGLLVKPIKRRSWPEGYWQSWDDDAEFDVEPIDLSLSDVDFGDA